MNNLQTVVKNRKNYWKDHPLTGDRDSKILEMYATGSYSYTTLSRIFKITSQRVGQIVKKHQKGKNES